MRKAMLISTLALAAVVLAAAGCGGKSATTTTTSTADWANGLCTAITTWKTSVDSAVGSVNGSNISKTSLQQAADRVKSANQAFADTIKGLGKPNTKAGAQAKQSLDQLSANVSSEQEKISSAVKGATSVSGVIQAAPVVLGSLQTMASDVSTTVKQLQGLDAAGELSSAFKQASACSGLGKSS